MILWVEVDWTGGRLCGVTGDVFISLFLLAIFHNHQHKASVHRRGDIEMSVSPPSDCENRFFHRRKNNRLASRNNNNKSKDLVVVPYLFVCRLHSDVANRLESGVCRVPFQLPDFAAGDDTTAPRTNFSFFF